MKWQHRVLSGFALSSSLAVAACSPSTQVHWVSRPPHALVAKPVDEVLVLTGECPARPHREIALLEVTRTKYSPVSHGQIVHELHEKAAALGCDAVRVVGAAPQWREGSGYVGSCVVFE